GAQRTHCGHSSESAGTTILHCIRAGRAKNVRWTTFCPPDWRHAIVTSPQPPSSATESSVPERDDRRSIPFRSAGVSLRERAKPRCAAHHKNDLDALEASAEAEVRRAETALTDAL